MPKVFISYSHDSEDHKTWVSSLAYDLRKNGIEVILDSDVKLGADLAKFMEDGVTKADRVLMICTEKYVEKANAPRGGVGYEKQIITAELFRDLQTTKFVPVIRQQGGVAVPTFTGLRAYIDFSKDEHYAANIKQLIKDLTGVDREPTLATPPTSIIKEVHRLEKMSGSAITPPPNLTFDDAMGIVVASNPHTDWIRVFRDHFEIWTYKTNLNLRIEYDGEDTVKDFREPWANKHPDPKAYSTIYYLCYGHSPLFQQLMVAVDGGRARLPAPRLADLSISSFQYAFGKICDPSPQYESYLVRSGINVK